MLLVPIVMLLSAGAAGFKAVVPGHGAAGIEQGQQAIYIMDTMDRRHEEEEHVFVVSYVAWQRTMSDHASKSAA